MDNKLIFSNKSYNEGFEKGREYEKKVVAEDILCMIQVNYHAKRKEGSDIDIVLKSIEKDICSKYKIIF